jgi:4-hydroxy-3-polyprenylbenzoate decarboxylase
MSTLTLKQLYELSLLGISVCVASPGFYAHPKKMEDLIDFVIYKVLNVIGIKSDLIPEWNTHDGYSFLPI